MYGIELITEATREPVTVTQVRANARIDTEISDTFLVQSIIPAARREIEERTNRQILNATWRLTIPCFPSDGILLPKGKTQSVTSVAYTDTADASQTLSSSEYELFSAMEPAVIQPAYGYSWPSIRSTPGAVVVNYVAGYGTLPEDVPEDLRFAILALATFRYEHPGDEGIGIPVNAPVGGKWQIHDLIDSYTVGDVFCNYGAA